MFWANVILVGLVVVLLVPVCVLCIECLAALLPARRIAAARGSYTAYRPTVAVVIPAHNEQTVLAETLASLLPQLTERDRVIVVADNCSDDTLHIARSFPVTAIERHDPDRIGKGYALDFAIQSLKSDPVEVVVMIDADCFVHAGSIDALVRQAHSTGRPAQACYLMERPTQFNPKVCVSALAFLVKNLVRPRGLFRLGLPCMLTGSGMAFPWGVIAPVKLASGNIVEDMQLGLDLALQGDAPLFCGEAHVTGRLPKEDKIAYGQRTRWEHGHLQTILSQSPRMFRAGLRYGSLQAIAMAMELSVPPLALLMLMLITACAAATGAGLLGAAWLAAWLLVGGIAFVGICLLGAWARFGRGVVPLSSLLAAPLYMAWKVPMYFAFLFKRQKAWNHTARAAVEMEWAPAGMDSVADLNLDLPAPPQAGTLMDLAEVKQLVQVLGKAAGQERTLRQALEGGIERLAVEDPALSLQATSDDLDSVESAAATAGPAMVYQSFLKGFVSELSPAAPPPAIHPQDGPLGRLRAVVLLGGAIRPSALSLALGRSLLDLPLEDGRSILWHWRDHVIELRRAIGLDQLPARVMVDQASLAPIAPTRGIQVRMVVERDVLQYRGTAGVLRDAAEGYDDNDYVLVANAGQALLASLPDLAMALAELMADVALVSHEDGSPSGLMLIRCQALRHIAASGYVDMKEQALPFLATRCKVRHLPHCHPTGLPIRTLSEYVAAIQHRYRIRLGKPPSNNPFAEDCQPSFAIVEDGACVHPTARVHDSVILRGSYVGENALVVRSVVGPGIRIADAAQIVDRLIAGETAMPVEATGQHWADLAPAGQWAVR